MMRLLILYFVHFAPSVSLFIIMLCCFVGGAVGDCLAMIDKWRSRK